MEKVIPFLQTKTEEMIRDINEATDAIASILQIQTEEHQLELREAVNNQLRLIKMSLILLNSQKGGRA